MLIIILKRFGIISFRCLSITEMLLSVCFTRLFLAIDILLININQSVRVTITAKIIIRVVVIFIRLIINHKYTPKFIYIYTFKQKITY